MVFTRALQDWQRSIAHKRTRDLRHTDGLGGDGWMGGGTSCLLYPIRVRLVAQKYTNLLLVLLGFFSFIFFSSATNRVSPLAVLSQSSPRLRVHSATLILRAHFRLRHEEIPSSARKQVVCRLFEHGEQYDQSARQRQEASNPWWSARVSLHPSTLPPHILLRLCRKHYLHYFLY